MFNDQLLNHIKQARESGIDDVKIREDLLNAGWTNSDIDEAMGQKSAQPTENSVDKPKHKSRLWLKVLLIIVGILVASAGVVAAGYYLEQRSIANLEETGSAEYKQYVEAIDELNEELLSIEAEMKAEGASSQEIELAKKDYMEFILSTIVLRIDLESSLTDLEKKAVFKKLEEFVIENESTLAGGTECEYTEQELPLQDFFVGATLKFKKPMVYLDWEEEQEQYCSPTMSSAQYLLQSVNSWNSTVFDKSGITEHTIDPSTTFTVEKRILLKRGGVFSEEREHYVLRDSNGVVSVPAFFYIFDQYRENKTVDDGEAGAELYKNDQDIGYVVSDISSESVWVHGTSIPQEVAPKGPTGFELIETIAKRDEFIKRVMFALEEGKIVNYTSKEFINNDIAKGIYTYQSGEVIHDYGGRVYMRKDGDTFSLIFEEIPRGQECYNFYNNDPETWGFGETYIDGVLKAYDFTGTESIEDRSLIYQEFRQRVCYKDKDSVTIEFRGDINEIKQKATYRKESGL